MFFLVIKINIDEQTQLEDTPSPPSAPKNLPFLGTPVEEF
jgi:hypothetical protein